jgi:pimeloyl-ACP methyl ester carboxylesterase
VVAAVRRRWRLVAILAAIGLALLLAAAAAVVSWLFSSRLLEPDHEPGPYGTAVERVEVRDLPGGGAYRVTFERDDTSSRPGLYGLDYPGGNAIAREIVAASDGEVTRRVTDVRGELEEGVDVAFDAAVWEGDPLASRGIPLPGDRLPLAARAHAGVAGQGARPNLGDLRARPQRHGARGAPRAAHPPPCRAAHALDRLPQRPRRAAERGRPHPPRRHGVARPRVGGTPRHPGRGAIVRPARRLDGRRDRVPVHPRIAARRARQRLVLDAPVLDWSAALDLQADERGFPGLLARTTEWAVSARIDFDWSAFDQIARRRDFRMPILLFHGTDDQTVPISSSDAFARALPERVTYHRVAGAGHVESWNVGPARYERRVRAFLARVLG